MNLSLRFYIDSTDALEVTHLSSAPVGALEAIEVGGTFGNLAEPVSTVFLNWKNASF